MIGYHDDNGYETWGIPEEYDFQKLYEVNGSWGANDLITAINSGKQFVHHVGHANSNYVAYMSNSDITNSNFYGANGVDHNFTIMQSAGCICGAFDDNDCIMEKMVSIENFAVAVIGNSRYGWFNEGQTEGPAQHLHREMMDAMYHEQLNHIGQAFVESKIQTAPWVTAPGQWEEGALRWNFYDINILGDPVLSIWTDEPMSTDVIYETSLPLGTSSTIVSVTNNGSPVENLKCCVVKDGILCGVGFTDIAGNALIEFEEALSTEGNAELVISGHNCLTEVHTIMIGNSTNVNENIVGNMNIYPNPAAGQFAINYSLTATSDVSIVLYNKLGQKVKVLQHTTNQIPGFYQLEFSRPELNRGIYFITIKSSTFSLSRKLIITK